jgi:hypothetical protein
MKKITEAFQKKTAGLSPSDVVRVIIELYVGEITSEKVGLDERCEDLQTQFEEKIRPTEEKIMALGGACITKSWLNRALSCDVSLAAVEQIDNLDQVRLIDVPRAMKREM